jgi:hypothetical protein
MIAQNAVRLAGGPKPLIEQAIEHAKDSRPVEALHLTAIVLAAAPHNQQALEVRLQALESLKKGSKNSNERGWLDYFIRLTKDTLGESK